MLNDKIFSPLKVHNVIDINSIFTFYLMTASKDFSFAGETHNFWEIDYVLKGKAGFTNEEMLFERQEGDIVIHQPNSFHSCWNIGKSSMKSFTISFDGDGLWNLLSSSTFNLKKEDKHLMNEIIECTKIVAKETNGEFYYNDPQFVFNAQPNNLQILKNLLETLCIRLSTYSQPKHPLYKKNDVMEKYKKSVLFLKNNLCSNLTIEQVAHELYESPSSLKRMFNKFANCGIITYYNRLRIEYAISLLDDGFSVGKIADVMNFSSQNYFSYFFKKNTGITPTQYKKNHNL
jgi:AraC-like DNA-binding protein